MRIISRAPLIQFFGGFEESKKQLDSWYKEAKKETWHTPHSVKTNFPKASILKNGRVIFDICGGQFRLAVKINYERQTIYIRFIGTHKEYDKIDANEI